MARILAIAALLCFGVYSHAAQYQSRELLATDVGEQSPKSLEELEKSLATLTNSYSKASTARYLARYYSASDADKAAVYYREALAGDGLSDYAKQDVLAELAQVYLRQKQYGPLLHALAQRRQLGGKDTVVLLLAEALAYCQTQQYSQAVASADAALAMEKNADAILLKQLLFVYFNSKAYARAAAMQERYLQFYPDDLAAWRNLAAIYLKLEKKGKAADALSVAGQKQLPLAEADIYLMVELYARNGNPYTAARLLDDAMQKQQVPATEDYYEKLYSYWMMARERPRAIAALQKTIMIKPELERYLQLAQLQMDEQQWQAMKDTLIAACRNPLSDHHVAHANLLLGISELKLGNTEAARRSFINALTVSSEGKLAADYLRYMEAEPPAESELSTLEGICLPAWARSGFVSLPAPAAPAKADAAKALQYTVKTSARQTLVTTTFSIAVAEMEQKLRPLAMQMATHIVKHGGQINGQLHFIFVEPVTPAAEVIRFQMAFPVRKPPQLPGRYKMLDDAGYKSASFVFSGAPQQLPLYWQKLHESVLADGLQPSGSARQIVLDAQAGREQITVELQLGIQ